MEEDVKVQNLLKRFPNVAPEVIILELEHTKGHAGEAAKRLRDQISIASLSGDTSSGVLTPPSERQNSDDLIVSPGSPHEFRESLLRFRTDLEEHFHARRKHSLSCRKLHEFHSCAQKMQTLSCNAACEKSGERPAKPEPELKAATEQRAIELLVGDVAEGEPQGEKLLHMIDEVKKVGDEAEQSAQRSLLGCIDELCERLRLLNSKRFHSLHSAVHKHKFEASGVSPEVSKQLHDANLRLQQINVMKEICSELHGKLKDLMVDVDQASQSDMQALGNVAEGKDEKLQNLIDDMFMARDEVNKDDEAEQSARGSLLVSIDELSERLHLLNSDRLHLLDSAVDKRKLEASGVSPEVSKQLQDANLRLQQMKVMKEICSKLHAKLRNLEVDVDDLASEALSEKLQADVDHETFEDLSKNVRQVCSYRADKSELKAQAHEKFEDLSKNVMQVCSYRADNSELKAQTKGIFFRNSKHLDDRGPHIRVLPWGSDVVGYDEGDDWVRVKEFFLPMTYNGYRILRKIENQREEETSSSVSCNSASLQLQAVKTPATASKTHASCCPCFSGLSRRRDHSSRDLGEQRACSVLQDAEAARAALAFMVERCAERADEQRMIDLKAEIHKLEAENAELARSLDAGVTAAPHQPPTGLEEQARFQCF